jgi:hypothetical protein
MSKSAKKENGGPVDFVGEPGPGAMIDQYLPQPGQLVARRVIRIEDIADEYFLSSATEAGTPWADYFGLEKSDDIWEIRSPELLTQKWFDRYERTSLSRGRTSALRLTMNASARGALTSAGSLVNWTRTGAAKASTARQSSAPDEAGNSDPLPGPDVTQGSGSGGGGGGGTNPGTAFPNGITLVADGQIRFPVENWAGMPIDVDVDLEAPPEPAFFLIQVVGISSFLGNYGLGRTVKTFTLLPGETTNIHTRTWRATEETMSLASSIIDSYDENAAERFTETVLAETTDTATREKSENWHVETGAKASIGIASASVEGGGGGEYSSGTEEFARSLDEAVREHAAESSSHRENTVTSSSESSVSTEEEEVIERTIQNINVERVLNFTFRELNQEYTTKTHIKDIRIGFTNGNADSWREEPVSGLRRLVEEFVKPLHVDKVCSDIIGTIAVLRDLDDTPVRVLEQVRLNACGTDFRVHDAKPDDDCVYPPPAPDGRMYYRFKGGPIGQPADEENPVDGLLLSERTIVMATDSVVVEALLGQSTALDEYSRDLQTEAIREKRLANDREELALRIIRSGNIAGGDLYRSVFGVCCSDEDDATQEPQS